MNMMDSEERLQYTDLISIFWNHLEIHIFVQDFCVSEHDPTKKNDTNFSMIIESHICSWPRRRMLLSY